MYNSYHRRWESMLWHLYNLEKKTSIQATQMAGKEEKDADDVPAIPGVFLLALAKQ